MSTEISQLKIQMISKASKSELEEALQGKANKSSVATALQRKANKADFDPFKNSLKSIDLVKLNAEVKEHQEKFEALQL